MVTQLQFDNDLRAANFKSPYEIVDFLCDKLCEEFIFVEDSKIPQDFGKIPRFRRDLAADLTVGSGEEFRDLMKINNHGLIQILKGVRSDLSIMKAEFLANHQIMELYGQYIIDHIMLDRIWCHLQAMRCPHLCPWCGVPCCGVAECNDKYEQGEVPCKEEAWNKHSCQFHRDITIIGESVNESNQLINFGNCPNLIQQNLTRRSWDQKKRKFVELPYTHYETTWRIRSYAYDDNNYGLFWKWFQAHVSSNYS